MRSIRLSRSRGFTLLEVVLAVALTAIIGTLIATAIDFHLRQLTVQRTRIIEAQVARAALRRIADDLRAATVYRPPEAASPSDDSGTGDTAGDGMDDGTASGTGNDVEGTSEATTSSVNLSIPGLFGDQFTLQVDVTRTPRPEELAFVNDMNSEFRGTLSDTKTVTYSMADGTSDLGLPAATDEMNTDGQTGLARRIADRASTRFALDNGIADLLDENVEIFAPEVVAIEFAYYDGLEWVLEWDSDLRGGLPIAVEITLVVMSAEQAAEVAVSGAVDSVVDHVGVDNVYRLVVHLPGSDLEQLAVAEEEAMTAEMGNGP